MPIPFAAPTGGQQRFSVSSLRGDIPASLVVFLVAIPLSLGIALASGAPLMSGLIAGMVGGIVAGFVGGAPLQVTGPTAGLTALVFGYTQQVGWPAMCVITICAGLLQIALGTSRVARVCLAVSPAVVHGMLAGIGITIVLSQLHIVLGGTPESHALINLRELPAQLRDHHGPATLLGLITIVVLLIWNSRWLPPRLKSLPGSLVAVGAVTLLSLVLHSDVARIDLRGGLTAGFKLPALPDPAQWGGVAVAAVTIALAASVESLIGAVATDKLHSGPRANLDRELIGQGLANTVSGALGGLPVTGVIVRSSANVRAGAKSQAATILHGVWILVSVALLRPILEQIPLAALAGLLVYVGLQLVNLNHIRTLLHHREALIYFATVAGVVGLNPLAGVGIGVALAIFLLLRRLATTQITVEGAGRHWHLCIEGTLTFLSVTRLLDALAQIPPGAETNIDLRVDFLDQAAFETLHDWRSGQERAGGRVEITSVARAAGNEPPAERAVDTTSSTITDRI